MHTASEEFTYGKGQATGTNCGCNMQQFCPIAPKQILSVEKLATCFLNCQAATLYNSGLRYRTCKTAFEEIEIFEKPPYL